MVYCITRNNNQKDMWEYMKAAWEVSALEVSQNAIWRYLTGSADNQIYILRTEKENPFKRQ